MKPVAQTLYFIREKFLKYYKETVKLLLNYQTKVQP